jgi:putative sterol carrier protein
MSSDVEEITKGLTERIGGNSGLNATLKFNFEGAGVVYIDGKVTPNTVSNEDKAADCTITVSTDNFKKMAAGELDGTTAFMTGKLKVAGDISIAMKLGPLLAKK